MTGEFYVFFSNLDGFLKMFLNDQPTTKTVSYLIHMKLYVSLPGIILQKNLNIGTLISLEFTF